MSGQNISAYPIMTVSTEDPAPLDIRQIFAVLRRRRSLFLAVFVVMAGLIGWAVMATPTAYTATASILVDERAPGLLRPNPDGAPASAPLDTGRVDTQVEIIRSRPFADRIVDQFGLEKDPEFNAALRPPGLAARLKALVSPGGRNGAANRGAIADRIDRQGVPDALLSHLKVTRVGVTYLLNLAMTANDPVKAKQLANAFTDQYLASQIDTKSVANRALNASLVPRLADLRKQVETAETAVQQYKIEHNLLSASGQTLTEQEVATLDQQLQLTKAQQVEIEARAATARAQLSRGSTGDDVGEALNSPVVQQLRQQRAVASQKVAELATRYGDRLPAMASARRDLADVDSQIQEEIRRIISNLDAQGQVARQRTNSIAQSVAQSRGNLVGNSRASVHLNELERNLDSLRSLYETLLNRYKQSSTEQGLEQAEAHVVTPAQTPASPSAPKKGLGAALALLVGLVGGTAAVALTEVLDPTVSTADKLRRSTALACLASLPTVKSTLAGRAQRQPPLEPLEHLQSHPSSSFAEAYRNLRTSLISSGLGRSSSVLAITSALPGEGKSAAAMCLGRTFANSGISVVVVDCDFKQHDVDPVSPEPTRSQAVGLLAGEGDLEGALQHDEPSGAWILPLSAARLSPIDVFNVNSMHGLIGNLRSRFDLVILDTSCVLGVADTRTLCAQADTTLLLVRWRKTPLTAVRAALALLANANAAVIGTALCFVNMKEQARTGYGDPEYYFNNPRFKFK